MIRQPFFVSLALAGSAAVAASAPVQPEAVPLEQQLQQARSEATAAAAQEQRLEAAAAAARGDVDRLRLRENAAAQAIDAAEARITAADMAVQLTSARLATQQVVLARQQAPASSLLGGLALMGRRPPLLLLAGGGSPEDIVKLRLLVDAVVPAIRAKTAALSTELRQSQHYRDAALAARADAQHSRAELAQREVQFAALEAKAAALAQTRGGEALAAGDVAMARQEQTVEIGRQATAARSTAAVAAGLTALGPAPERPFPGGSWPGLPPFAYRLPAESPVTTGLGEISDSGIRSRGITLATRRGTPVAAPAAGVILFSGPFRDFNGVVIIGHGGNWKTVLVNVASTLPAGSKLESGQRIGTALGPVEVELLRGGQPVSAALIAGSSQMLSNRPKGR